MVLAGGDAYNLLAPAHPVVRIPHIRFEYTTGGKVSTWRTIRQNTPAMLDIWVHGPSVRAVADAISSFGADVVLTDSEGFSNAAARSLGLPRISFDHFGVLAYCDCGLTGFDRVRRWFDAKVYRLMCGRVDRVIASAFFPAKTNRAGVHILGPIIREAVRNVTPTWGDHVVVYLSNGAHEFIPSFEAALQATDCPMHVYGAPRTGTDGHITYKPVANQPFIEDLASCRAVISTTGNQLSGEVLYFRKPILGMPVECLEQRLNAMWIQRMGVGKAVKRSQVSKEVIASFLAHEQAYREALTQYAVPSLNEVADTIIRVASELVDPSAGPSSASCPARSMEQKKGSTMGPCRVDVV